MGRFTVAATLAACLGAATSIATSLPAFAADTPYIEIADSNTVLPRSPDGYLNPGPAGLFGSPAASGVNYVSWTGTSHAIPGFGSVVGRFGSPDFTVLSNTNEVTGYSTAIDPTYFLHEQMYKESDELSIDWKHVAYRGATTGLGQLRGIYVVIGALPQYHVAAITEGYLTRDGAGSELYDFSSPSLAQTSSGGIQVATVGWARDRDDDTLYVIDVTTDSATPHAILSNGTLPDGRTLELRRGTAPALSRNSQLIFVASIDGVPGIHRIVPNGDIETLVSVGDTLDGNVITNLGTPMVDKTGVNVVAHYDAGEASGILAYFDGHLFDIAHTGQLLDGNPITAFGAYPAVSGDWIAFTAGSRSEDPAHQYLVKTFHCSNQLDIIGRAGDPVAGVPHTRAFYLGREGLSGNTATVRVVFDEDNPVNAAFHKQGIFQAYLGQGVTMEVNGVEVVIVDLTESDGGILADMEVKVTTPCGTDKVEGQLQTTFAATVDAGFLPLVQEALAADPGVGSGDLLTSPLGTVAIDKARFHNDPVTRALAVDAFTATMAATGQALAGRESIGTTSPLADAYSATAVAFGVTPSGTLTLEALEPVRGTVVVIAKVDGTPEQGVRVDAKSCPSCAITHTGYSDELGQAALGLDSDPLDPPFYLVGSENGLQATLYCRYEQSPAAENLVWTCDTP